MEKVSAMLGRKNSINLLKLQINNKNNEISNYTRLVSHNSLYKLFLNKKLIMLMIAEKCIFNS